ncbi:MAG: SDR family NAD(P)-dependent oxidoreductase [Flavobacteriaceae bacterium]|nr:SDR family NAD(P)-dependent oxidoreductase [Flavobacteriaceae bacterium]
MKRILLTGCAGFIGSHIAEALLNKGYVVVGIDNFCDYYNPEIKWDNIANAQENPNFILLKIDIRNKEEVQQAFQKYTLDAVVHLAGMAGVRPSIEQVELYSEVNIMGTLNLLEAMKQHQVKKYIFASSSSVYGNTKKVPFAETDNVDNAISPYAGTKKAGEILAYTYHHLYNMDMALLRFFTVYGERQRPDLAIHKFTKLISNEQPIPFYGDGTSLRDYTYISDIVDGVLRSLEYVEKNKGVYEILNLGAGRTISLQEMVETIEKALGKKAIIDRKPMQNGDVVQTFADITKAKTLVGYNPKTSFEEGIQRFVKWYKIKKG